MFELKKFNNIFQMILFFFYQFYQFIFTAIRSGDYYMFDEFDDELDSIVEKDNELSDDSLEDSDKTDSKFDYQVKQLYYLKKLIWA